MSMSLHRPDRLPFVPPLGELLCGDAAGIEELLPPICPLACGIILDQLPKLDIGAAQRLACCGDGGDDCGDCLPALYALDCHRCCDGRPCSRLRAGACGSYVWIGP